MTCGSKNQKVRNAVVEQVNLCFHGVFGYHLVHMDWLFLANTLEEGVSL